MSNRFIAGRSSLKKCVSFFALVLLWTGFAIATDNYAYQANEYAIISGGKSPDGHWSIVAHGDGEYGYDGFGLYLMREPTHDKPTPLRTGDHLDTAPLSIIALWAPDSGHVVLLYRTDRHVLNAQVFGVSAGRVRTIEAPSLVDTVGRGYFKPGVQHELFGRYYRVAWQQANIFALEEFDGFTAAEPIFRAGLKAYLKVDQEGTERAFTEFSASAECEVTPGGKLRFSEIKPLPDQQRTIIYSPHLLVDPERGLHDTETTMSSIEAQKNQR